MSTNENSDADGGAATASLAKTSAVMAAGTIVSRALGMVRASMQTWVVGLALAGDAFEVANTLPNTLYLLLAGGVLNAVLVPQITRATSHADGGEDFVNRLITLAITGIAAVAVLVTLAAPLLVRVFAPSFNPDALELSARFALICVPQVFFYGLYTVFGQVLNARGQFAGYMWAPVAANVVAITGLAVFLTSQPLKAPVADWTPGMIWLLAGSATLGVVVQALVLVVPLWRGGFRFRPRWGFRGVGLRSASTVAGWTFAALAVSQLGFVVTSAVLSLASETADRTGVTAPGRAAYGQAFLLFMLPHSLVTVSLVTALFTRMSKAAHEHRPREVRADLLRGMRLTAVATVPATVLAFVLGSAATTTIYPGNTVGLTGLTRMMMAMMAGLIPFGLLYLLQRVFYAFEDARTPFRLQLIVTTVATLANLASALLPVQWIGVGVGVGQSLSNLAGLVVGLVLVRRRLGGLPLGGAVRTYVRLGVAALVAGAVALPVQWVISLLVPSRLGAPLTLVLAGTAFAVVYFALAQRMRVREVSELLGPIIGRARRILPGR